MRRGRPRGPRAGNPLTYRKQKVPFSLYPKSLAENGRQLVSDPWSYLLNHLKGFQVKRHARQHAEAFIYQSRYFFEAANTSRAPSQPLLYYYAFMNMAKAWIVLDTQHELSQALHGIQEHPENFQKTYLYLSAQKMKIESESKQNVHIFRELMRLCGGNLQNSRETIRIEDVLCQIVGIHRTYSTVFGHSERFFPIVNPTFRRALEPQKGIFLTLDIEKRHFSQAQELSSLKRNCGAFKSLRQISSEADTDCYGFESQDIVSCERFSPTRLAELMEPLRPYLHALLSRAGYRYYFRDYAHCRPLPQLAAIYAGFYYLGSVTRYHPYDFAKIREGQYGWLIDEFLKTQPIQFVYLCASHMVKSDLYIPFSAL